MQGWRFVNGYAGRAHARNADQAYADLNPILEKLRAKGFSLRTIADHLNGKGYTTRRDKPRTPTQVARVLRRTRTSRCHLAQGSLLLSKSPDGPCF